MPKETFWDSATAVEGDGVSEPVLTVTWGDTDGVYLNGVHFDESGIVRLSNVLRRAIGKDKTVSVTLTANVDAYVEPMERATAATRSFVNELRVSGIPDADVADLVQRLIKRIEQHGDNLA